VVGVITSAAARDGGGHLQLQDDEGSAMRSL